MKALVIGSGGREHALAWRIAQSPRISKVFVAPGNAGTAVEDGLFNIPIQDTQELIKFAKDEVVALTVVGPEIPLSQGIVDTFRAQGLKIFGPTRNAARLESSKEFAKEFMRRHNIPTAEYATFDRAATAHEYVERKGAPIVIKADGLAAGKGVVVAMDVDQAHAAIDMILVDSKFGAAGNKLIIEEHIVGEEASFIVVVDGKNALPLATSQDYKRLNDGNLGPNTGGMGAVSPTPVITPQLHARVMREVMQPVISGMEQEGEPYTGFLYAGLMITNQGEIKVLEFNCRLGDPETQPIMLRLKSDLFTLLENATQGTLNQVEAEWDRRVAVGIVLASQGYPDAPRKGDVISEIPKAEEDAHIFHAATARRDEQWITNGGRVLCVTALGGNLSMAQRRAYQIAERIQFDGRQMRSDIGHRGGRLPKAVK